VIICVVFLLEFSCGIFLFLNFYLLILVPYFIKPDNELCTTVEIIDTLEECKVASSGLDLTFSVTVTDSRFPKGCFAHSNRGTLTPYWNDHSSGGNDSDSHPICKNGEPI